MWKKANNDPSWICCMKSKCRDVMNKVVAMLVGINDIVVNCNVYVGYSNICCLNVISFAKNGYWTKNANKNE